jgi:selenocysteine lyase/cysteine desulfurase
MQLIDIESARKNTPGCAERIHLNNAGASLMPRQVMDTIHAYIDLEGRIGGYEAQAQSTSAIEEAYLDVADLLATSPRNIAFTENATAAFAQALSSIPFEPGDLILTTRNDYSSNQIQFLSLKKRLKVEVMHAPDGESGGVDVAAMNELIVTHKPRMVCVTQVPTNSGIIQDVAAIGRVCNDLGVWYMVDACQSVGQMPVDAHEIGCDFLSATARKFLRGPRGSGFLYVSDRALEAGLEPLFIDMLGADWVGEGEYKPRNSAQRFENWEFPWALVLGTGAAARYARSLGLEAIEERVTNLAIRVQDGLDAIPGVRVLHRQDGLCGIVTASLDLADPFELVSKLRSRNINTSAQNREYAVIDYDEKGVKSALRISPHYYNTKEEIDRALEALEECL